MCFIDDPYRLAKRLLSHVDTPRLVEGINHLPTSQKSELLVERFRGHDALAIVPTY